MEVNAYADPDFDGLDSAQTETAEYAATRLSFFFLALYVLSQAFLIPVVALGHWSLWPRFSDLAFAALLVSVLLGSRAAGAVTVPQRRLLLSLVTVFCLCSLSYLLTLGIIGKELVVLDGAHNLFRLAQFILLYWCAIQIPLDERRLRILGRMVDIAFFAVCLSIFLTYFKILPLRALTYHLPRDPAIAGNWADYAHLDKFPDVRVGLGTVGYTHAYGAVQPLLLLALRLHIWAGRRNFLAAAYVLIALGTVLLTESRAGFAAGLLFAAAYALHNPKVLLGAILLGPVAVAQIDWREIEGTLRRQETITYAGGQDSFSGRPRIWASHLKTLREKPMHVLMGGGFGSSRMNGGSNSHMLYLEILSETGAAGLLFFAALAWTVLRSLYRYGTKERALFWLTTALLLSAFTQETFYPVPSLGHFIGFYLTTVAIVLRR